MILTGENSFVSKAPFYAFEEHQFPPTAAPLRPIGSGNNGSLSQGLSVD